MADGIKISDILSARWSLSHGLQNPGKKVKVQNRPVTGLTLLEQIYSHHNLRQK